MFVIGSLFVKKSNHFFFVASDMDEPVSLLHINVNASSLPSHLNAHVATLDEPSSPIHLDVATLDKQTSSVASNLRESGFVDANMAGGNLSKSCTLILTEGLSAKSFVVSGCTKF